MFAAPIDEARAAEAAWNGDTEPSPPTSDLNIFPNVCLSIKGRYFIWINPILIEINIPPPSSTIRIGHPQNQPVAFEIKSNIACIIYSFFLI